MDSEMIISLLALVTTIFLLYNIVTHSSKPQAIKNLPPTPPSLPILGHLHLLKTPFHRTFQTLAQYYGPVYSLRLGHQPVLVVSSAQAAEDCFSQNDVVFANRPNLLVGQHLGYNNSVVIWAPYGTHWRNLRRVTTLLAFSRKKINEGGPTRRGEIHGMIKELMKRSSESENGTRIKVNLNGLFDKMVRNIMMRLVNGKAWDCEFRGPPAPVLNVCDFVPVLRCVGYKGEEKNLIKMGKERDEFLGGMLAEFREKRGVKNGTVDVDVNWTFHQTVGGQGQLRKTLVEELLDLQEEDPEYFTDDILKGILMAVLLAGTHTSMRALEWSMSLLLNHPKALEKARLEIDTQIGKKRLVDDDDISKLSYIRCIINETLRLFPPAPLLIPHSSSQDCIIGGYHVEKGTLLFVNVWALHRDPKLWKDPIMFKPERFEKEKEGFKFMPFGIGRRSCPGNNFALTIVTLVLATLIQCFDWETDEAELVDLAEYRNALVMTKEKPLEVICQPRSFMINIMSQMQWRAQKY